MDTTDQLAEDPRPDGTLAMGGGRYRQRVGRHRVSYDVNDQVITVTVVRCGRVAT